MTRVFYSSTFFGAMTLAAAIDAGLFGEHTEPWTLIVSANGSVPEISSRVDEIPGFETLRQRFDHVVSWNDIIAPLHPAAWTPASGEVPLLSRLMGSQLAITDTVTELVLESIAVAPARTLATLIRDCPITVFSDGLMSYGPTRDSLPGDIAGRVRRLLYLDLIPSLEPLLLREYDVPAVVIPDAAFARVIADLPAPVAPGAVAGCPIIVGQYLSALGILSAVEESALHTDMLEALVKQGHRHVVFKPHPGGGREHVAELRAAARTLSVDLTVVTDPIPVEVWFARSRPELVVSCFSTALLTASHYFGLSSATMGCETALERIAPYENSNRIPATIVDATVAKLQPDGRLCEPPRGEVTGLVRAVGFCMQAGRHPDLRPEAITYLAAHGPERYFKKRRLEAVGLASAPLRRSVVVLRARRVAGRAVARWPRSVLNRRRPRVPRSARL